MWNPYSFTMRTLLRILLIALSVMGIALLLPGVQVDNFGVAVVVAIVLGILNFLVRPIIVILTIPITVVTLGLFLLFINAFIIQIADSFIGGFRVDSIWWALLFSLILSVLKSIVDRMLEEEKPDSAVGDADEI